MSYAFTIKDVTVMQESEAIGTVTTPNDGLRHVLGSVAQSEDEVA